MRENTLERAIDGEQLDASFTALPVLEVRERQLDAQLSDWLRKKITKTAPLLPRKTRCERDGGPRRTLSLGC